MQIILFWSSKFDNIICRLSKTRYLFLSLTSHMPFCILETHFVTTLFTGVSYKLQAKDFSGLICKLQYLGQQCVWFCLAKLECLHIHFPNLFALPAEASLSTLDHGYRNCRTWNKFLSHIQNGMKQSKKIIYPPNCLLYAVGVVISI